MKPLPIARLLLGLLIVTAAIVLRPASTASGAAGPVLSVDPEAPYIYVCNESSATVTVVDAITLDIVDVVDLKTYGFDTNSKPHHVAVEPDGSFWYVSLISAGKVLKMDRENNLVGSADFETPGMLALHPSRDFLFVGRSMKAVNPPQRIGMVERATMELEEMDVFFPRPHALAVDPRGDYLYTASLSVNQFLSMNIESGEIHLENVPGETHTFVQFALSPDGRTMAVGGQLTGQVLVFDTSDPENIQLETTIDVNAAPWHPTFTPDGRYLYVGNKMANTVTVIDMDKREVATVIEGEGLSQPHGIGVSPDGRYVFVSNNNLSSPMQMNMGAGQGHEAGEHDMHQTSEKKEDQPGTLVVIDAEKQEIVKVLELGFNSTGVGSPSFPGNTSTTKN